MRTSTLLVICVGLVVLAAPTAGRGADANSTTRPAATSQPAGATAAKAFKPAPDVISGPVDPYQPGTERAAFFKAAGVDNELDAKEFAAAQKKAGSFVRRFDEWKAMLPFDKNHNGRVDWFEADAYRRDVRKRVLSAFDTNRDGWLTGRERSAANEMLAAGLLPGETPAPAERVHIPETQPQGGGSEDNTKPGAAEAKATVDRLTQATFDKYDTNHDGTLDAAEHQAMIDAVGKAAQAEIDDMLARRFDANGDGVLDDAEQAALEKFMADRQARLDQARAERELRQFDTDGDGKLSAAEQEAADDARGLREATARRWREQADLRRFDLDGDGKLSQREQMLADIEAVRRDIYAQAPAGDDGRGQDMRAALTQWRLRNFDADGDGQMSPAEQEQAQAFERRLRDVGDSFRRRMEDLNGDGEVTEAERQAVRKQWQAAGWKIFTRSFRYMDADGDGQVSLAERTGFQRRMQTGFVSYMERFSASFDADHDGKLDARERDELVKGMGAQFDERTKQFDADKDGRLSPDETINMMEDFAQRELGLMPNDATTRPAESK